MKRKITAAILACVLVITFSGISVTFGEKVTPTLTFSMQKDKVYDGTPINPPDISVLITDPGNDPYFLYKDRDNPQSNWVSILPVNAGRYYVRGVLQESANYASISNELTFSIARATGVLEFTVPLSKLYDGAPISTPNITSITTDSGNLPVFTYEVHGSYDNSKVEMSSVPPSKAGSHAVIANLAQSTNYTAVNKRVEFVITLPSSLSDPNGDADGDHFPNEWEFEHGTNPLDENSHPPLDQDTDGDDVPDWWEFYKGTDPENEDDFPDLNEDTDGDKIPDKVELKMGSDPLDPLDIPDLRLDSDNDKVPDWWEIYKDTDPNDANDFPDTLEDTDGDRIPDKVELEMGSDPLDAEDIPDLKLDSDDDKVPDWWEIYKDTDPNDEEDYPDTTEDTDGDKVPDKVELEMGSDPLDPNDKPDLKLDSDDDKVPDWWEIYKDTDPEDAEDYPDLNDDTDDDLVPDRIELMLDTDPLDPDDMPDFVTNTDGDDLPNWAWPDWIEIIVGTDPLDPNDFPDRFLDSDEDDWPDWIEIIMGTDPFDENDFPDEELDTNKNGIPDRDELKDGKNPYAPYVPPTGGGGGGGGGGGKKPTSSPIPPLDPMYPELIDISGHWAEYQITVLLNAGILNGYPLDEGVNQFMPEKSITRAEFTKLMAQISGDEISLIGTLDVADIEQYYYDVHPADWFAPSVMWADQKAMVQGYEDGRFSPEMEITRQEAALVVKRFVDAKNIRLEDKSARPFSDASTIADWALPAVNMLHRTGVITGDDWDYMRPMGKIKRCEAAKMLYEVYMSMQ
ncbi:MAG: S-layer homology domain-containing protein [Clostridiales bacterium]|jgi:hypothetical protein|nr:S-layer homology domain-containing protein [Clostridiales bacterium]